MKTGRWFFAQIDVEHGTVTEISTFMNFSSEFLPDDNELDVVLKRFAVWADCFKNACLLALGMLDTLHAQMTIVREPATNSEEMKTIGNIEKMQRTLIIDQIYNDIQSVQTPDGMQSS